MHHLALLSILLAPLAAAAPSAVGLHARDSEVTIYGNPSYRGQSQKIPTNGICVNLRPPFSLPGRGIRSVRFTVPRGEYCEFHKPPNCQDSDPERLFESDANSRITAGSILCSKSLLVDDDD
ncbi:hypothetical protein K4F52_004911 [Lecanicillium sp. MT-2017a]|nr:hypothetical protein K4F52_004911 [Lecanicillium sp. MT-2017a]